MHRVEDNFLPYDFYTQVRSEIIDGRMPFVFSGMVADSEDSGQNSWYFVHQIFLHKEVQSQYYQSILLPILEKLDAKAVFNAKVNLYPSTEKIYCHGLHSDQNFDVKSAVINFTTCDGYTYLKDEDEIVKSVENRCIHFNSKNLHHSTTTTDSPIRVTMNINYF